MKNFMKENRLQLTIAAVVALVVIGGGLVWLTVNAAGFFSAVEPESSVLATNATSVDDATASGGKAIQFNAPATTTPTPPTTGPCPNALHTPGGSDGMGGCWPGLHNTGVPDGTVLTAYTGSCVIQTNTVIDKKDVNQRCTELIVRNGAKLTVTNSKTPRIESTSEGNLGSVEISYSNIDAPGWVEGALWGYNLSADYVEITGGQHNYHCNNNCKVTNSYLHKQHNPNGGSYHNNAFISNGGENMNITHNSLHCDAILNSTDGGCSGDLSLFGDFDPIKNVTIDKNLLMANNSSISYCLYAGTQPGKPYPNASGIVVRDNVFQRGANKRCGVYGPVSSFQPSAAGNIWTNNKWDDGTVLNSSM